MPYSFKFDSYTINDNQDLASLELDLMKVFGLKMTSCKYEAPAFKVNIKYTTKRTAYIIIHMRDSRASDMRGY